MNVRKPELIDNHYSYLLTATIMEWLPLLSATESCSDNFKFINNVFKEGELEEKSNVQILHISGTDRPVKF